ncbi:MAG: radical SAM protein [Candidatus Omnitrophota bacterium]|nr:radical SAM protein [Candidatus Omnitrophota bacterium]
MNILAINPWIYDFAAYDFWLKPYGFLVILEYLKNQGIHVDYIDCLDKKTSAGDFGRGKYACVIVEKPGIFKTIPRHYKRYGINRDVFKAALEGKNPDYILITSSMTYWYPGIIEAARLVKEKFPAAKILLGGTYATLCNDHAAHNTLYDRVFANNQIEEFFTYLGITCQPRDLYTTLPRYEEFYQTLDYVVLRTSWGCPFNCSFCAIRKLFPGTFLQMPQASIIDYISGYCRKGVRDYVLYDDAFLYESDYAKSLLRNITAAKLGIRFHTPNALHMRFLDDEIASLLKTSGFTNPHFGLETLDPELQKLWGDKIDHHDVIKGAAHLKQGGFKNGEASVYLLLGYPGQDLVRLKEDVLFLIALGLKVSLAEFSPVPDTPLFEHYGKEFNEPLLHNNSIFGSFQQHTFKEFWEIKNFVRELNKKL